MTSMEDSDYDADDIIDDTDYVTDVTDNNI